MNKGKPATSRRVPRAIPVLLLDRPLRTYKADAYANVLFPSPKTKNLDDQAMAVKGTRREVNRAAKIAVMHENHEQIDLQKARKRAKGFIRWLKAIQSKADKYFPDGDVTDMAEGFAATPTESNATPLVQITVDFASLRAWTAELQQIGIAASGPSNSDPLGKHFVIAMKKAHLSLTGEPAPHSRKGPFVNLLAAAWEDLDFPWPSSETSLEAWLGSKVERYRI